jgi:hypothetical protein
MEKIETFPFKNYLFLRSTDPNLRRIVFVRLINSMHSGFRLARDKTIMRQ